MMKFRLQSAGRAVLVLLIAALPTVAEGPFSARVIKVKDGDSLAARYGAVEVEIRLFGIDAPEKGQPYYLKARDLVNDLAYQQTVTVVPRDRDKYKRYVSDVVLPDGRSLNQEVVKAGLAWWYRNYAPDNKTLAALEAKAKEQKIGLWADPDPVPPWDWRAKLDSMPVDVSGGFCASRNSSCYHFCSCETVSTIKPKNLVRFKTEEEAVKSGKRRCKCCAQK